MKLQAKSQANVEWQACSEVIALRRAAHPFIVKLEAALQTPHFYALLMELCTGGDMNKVICAAVDADGRRLGLPAERAARYTGQVLLALVHLHETLGIVYRDVKLENVLLSAKDEAKLADFGLAVYVGVSNRASMNLAGTPGFLAPELVFGESFSSDGAAASVGGGIDPFKTDAYSFGVLLAVMLLGQDIADVYENTRGDPWLVPQLGNESEATAQLDNVEAIGRLPLGGRSLLSLLLPHSPARRCRLADAAVVEHEFFLTALGCTELGPHLLPARGS